MGGEASGEGRNAEGREGQEESKKGSKKTCFEGETIDLDWAAPYLLIVNVTRLYIGYSNTQLILTHARLVDLQTGCLLCCSLAIVERSILLGVGEFLGPEDLNFPVLLDERDSEERVVVDGTEGGLARDRSLRRG